MPDKTSNNIPIPDSLDNAFKNLSDGPTKEIGALLDAAFYRCFGGFCYRKKAMQILREQCLIELKKRIEKGVGTIPTEKLIKPDFQTLILALNNAELTLTSEELRERFANLITRSCNIDYKNFMHPSFATILGQMSPFDAKVLKFYADNKIDHFITYTYKSSDGKRFDRIPYMFDGYPDAEESPLVALSVSVLMHLGILAVHDDAVMYRVENSPFMDTDFYKRCEQERIEEGKYQSSSINGQMSVITPYGYSFIQACF